MLLEREVIRYPETGQDFRIVRLTPERAVLFDLKAETTTFVERDRRDLADDVEHGQAVILLDNDYDRTANPERVTPAQRANRDRMVRIVAPLVARDDIFDTRARGRAVSDIEKALHACMKEDERDRFASAKTVHKALHRYWRRGMTPAALLPDFEKCGQGDRKVGAAKRGRPRDDDKPRGVNVTPEIAEIFDWAVRRRYASNRRNTLKGAYKQMIAEKFSKRVVDKATGEEAFVIKPEYRESGLPSYRQFTYWYSKRDDILEIRKRRMGAAKYEKDCRAITGVANKGLFGVGDQFEIDATKLDVGCVSEIDRTAYVGRPTFYQVTDTTSKLITGIYVGFEEASWRGAMLAVRNIVEDKVAFCARFGVGITRDQWPIEGMLPMSFLADRGEFEGYDANGFNEKSGVEVKTTAPYRGDNKGSGEKRFDMVHELLRPVLDGFVEKDHAERGEEDYRRSARMTVKEVTAAVIRVVLFLNNHHELVGMHRSRHMVAEQVPPIPAEVWRWCVGKGYSNLSRSSLVATAFALLPVGQAVVTKHGFRFKNLYYEGEDGIDADAFARARQDGVSKVVVSWDPLWSSNVYLHDEEAPNGFRKLVMTERSVEFADVSFADVSELKRIVNVASARREAGEMEAYAFLMRRLKEIRTKARKARSERLSTASLNGTREARGAAKEREREAGDAVMPRDAVGNDNEPMDDAAPMHTGAPTAAPMSDDDRLQGAFE